jgi:hypothetical protein
MNKDQHLEKNTVNAFVEAVFGALANLVTAGEIAAKCIAEDPGWIDKVIDKCPDMTIGFIRKMQAIGLKRLHPSLAINESPGVRRLIRLPYPLQEQYAKMPIPLLIKSNGGCETLQVDVRNLTREQSRQVFADDHVRDDAEQRAWIEDRAAQHAAPHQVENSPYRIVKGEVIIMAPCRLARADLLSLLTRLER